MPIWNPEYESMARDDLEKLQAERLSKIAAYVYDKIPIYRQKFKALSVTPGDINCLDDLKRLPFTAKQDLRDAYPFDNFAVPMAKVARIHASSGTTGKPTVGGYSRQDLDLWAEVMARTVTSCGVTDKDVAHNRSEEHTSELQSH